MCLKSLKQQIRDIHKDDLRPLLNSKIPKVRQTAQEVLNNPGLYSDFMAVLRLILRPVHRNMMLLRDSMIEAQKEQRYPSLLNSLSSSDIAEKETAIQELTEYPGKETNKLIADQLLNGPRGVRMACVEALWKMRMKDAVDPWHGGIILGIGLAGQRNL